MALRCKARKELIRRAMNTHTFDHHSVTCPICQRAGNLKQIKKCNGLFTCPHCQERLVVSWSGHYVRDPHSSKQVEMTHLLRRQSRPWARILRDFSFIKRTAAIAAIGSAILLGISVVTLETLKSGQESNSEPSKEIVVDPPQEPS